jgi:K+-sensing histidine kinase KdpD
MLLVVVMAQVGVLVLVLAAERPALLLLALGPMLAAYLLLRSESRAVLARQDAEATARREAELRAQEQEVARKLRETDQMKDDLLAMVSHELRTPLTTVVGRCGCSATARRWARASARRCWRWPTARRGACGC